MKPDCLRDVVETIKRRLPPEGMSTKVVAIDGPGGAGKSSLAESLAQALDGAQIVHTDDFASPENPRDWWSRLIEDVLAPLSRNDHGRYRRTNWTGDKSHFEWGEIAPTEFLLLEGVSASRNAFRPFLSYSIWIETPRELRLDRGLERDGEQARDRWEQWMTEEDEYVEQEKPQQAVDLVLRGDQDLWI